MKTFKTQCKYCQKKWDITVEEPKELEGKVELTDLKAESTCYECLKLYGI